MTAPHMTMDSLLLSLTESLSSASTAFPVDQAPLLPPADGISLLDVKNELLLSYLQNLVFLIILRLRNHSEDTDTNATFSTQAIKKLVEQRVYLEKGVRPLEGRLKYQIDKVLRAADDAERLALQKTILQQKKTSGEPSNGHASSSASKSETDSDLDVEAAAITDLSYRPNPSALLHKNDPSTKRTSSKSRPDGSYRPPRITPTSMPSTSRPEPRARHRTSHLIDEYIANDLSSAPMAQPSIGSNGTILDRGRGGLSSRDREKEKERTRYEESNFTRLPGESKAERKKARASGAGGRRDMFGGEDWTGLGGLGDRVSRSVSGGKGKAGVLERREKRQRDTTDSGRGDGVNLAIGETFEKRRRVLAGRMERKGKGRRG